MRSQPDRLTRASGWYVQTFMKRLRKTGFAVRYLWVPEPHLDGFPHWHGLIYDQRGDTSGKQVWKKKATGPELVTVCPDIEKAWSAGFIDTELVRDAGAISYVTKYIAKGRYGRIRASARFGADQGEDQQALACVPSASICRVWLPAGWDDATTMSPNDDVTKERKQGCHIP